MSVRSLIVQPDGCEICQAQVRLVEDHDHATGEFRGWLCSHCNTGLGMFGDSREKLRTAVEYLERPPQRTLSSLRDIAAQIGEEYATVKKWFQRGRIPERVWQPLIAASSGAITADLLLSLNKPRKKRET